MSCYHFKNGFLADVERGRLLRAELVVRDARIEAIAPQLHPRDAKIINLQGRILSPGFIDLHVHLREPGFPHKETMTTGAAAAAAGGFTTIACMPNTKPPLDRAAKIAEIVEEARACPVKILPIAAITQGQEGKKLTDFAALKSAGAVAFSDDGLGVQSTKLMLAALELAGSLGMPVMAHMEDEALAAGNVNAGLVSDRLGDAGIHAAAEYVMLARDLYLNEIARGHLHVCHVSAGESVELIRRAKSKGVRVTAEVTPHHLHLTEEAVPRLLGQAKVNPPLRSEADRQVLVTALRDGVIDIIATDHAPHAAFEKELPLARAAFGFSGLETAFAIANEALVRTGVMPMAEVLARLTCKPAAILGLPQGRLAAGAPADLVVLDETTAWTVRAAALRSQGKNTPYMGQKLLGKVLLTMVDGKIIFGLQKEDKL